MLPSHYLIALGSNRPHHLYGPPARILAAAGQFLDSERLALTALSRVMGSRPIGPSQRRFANGAAIVTTTLDPPALLRQLKAIEAVFGQRRGQRWGQRALDLDIILWSGGIFASSQPPLAIPHPAFAERNFVLTPARQIAPDWRDPISGRTIAQLAAINQAPRPVR